MRILFVLPYVPSLIRVRPYNFIRELAKRHEVSVIATVGRGELEAGEVPRRYCRRIDLIPLSLPVRLRRCIDAGIGGYPLQSMVSQHPALADRLKELLTSERFDVVHVEHLRAARIAEAMPNTVPTLFDSVDCISLLLERTIRQSHSLFQRILARVELSRTRAFEASLLMRFDQVIATSPEDASALMALDPSRRVAVVTNGVDLERLGPTGARREPATLVLSGKMSYHANVTATMHFVRRIFPLIRAKRPDARLRIVGSNPPAAIRALSRDPAIAVTGYVPDMRMALADATVAICPVVVKVGVQNKLLEAMAMSLPVVSTRVGVQGLTANDGEDLLVADSDSEFADQVCRLLSQPGLREVIGQSGRRYVEANHRWETVVQSLEHHYFEAIARRNGNLAHPRVEVAERMGERGGWPDRSPGGSGPAT